MSNVLYPLASRILDYLLFASLLAFVFTSLVSVTIKIAGIRAPIYRYMVWKYALIGVVVFPALWLNGPILSLKILPAENRSAGIVSPEMDTPQDVVIAQNPSTDDDSPRLISEEAAVRDHTILPRPFPTKAMLAGIWLYGAILMLIRLFVGWFRLRRIYFSAEPLSGNSRLEIKDGGRLKILMTSQVNSPVCFGLWQPVILLPQEMYDDGPIEDLEMALSHELAHIERKDCYTNLLQRVVEAIFFFHPFVWYASLQLTQERERICDNYVIQKGARIMDYSKFLSRIAEQKFEKMRFQTVALFEGRLLQRIRSLLDPKRSHKIKASRWAILAGTVAVTACLIFGTIRLEAKPNIDKDSVVPQSETIIGNPESRPKGNCSISGKVISAETDKPIKHASVILSIKGYPSIMVRVASDSTFVFEEIPIGPFCLSTTNTLGFQDVYYNPDNQSGSRPQFSLADGEKRKDVVLKVKPACSITGQILDENGEPLRGQRLYVHAYAESIESNGQKSYKKVKSKRMGLDSSYALNDLDGRPVYVLVIDPSSELKDEYYPPCYYPGTVDRNKAQKVTFDETMSVKQIDIRLQNKGEFVLEGIVTDEKTGKAIPKALVTIHHRDMLFDQVTVYTDERGHYRIETIGAGEFLVHVDAKPWGYVRIRKAVDVKASIKTTVLDFKLKLGVTISGKFVDESGNPIEIDRSAFGSAWSPNPPGKNIQMYSGAPNRYSAKGLTDTVFHDGEGDYETERMIFPTPSSFTIEGMIPGKTILEFFPQTKGQTVKEILYNGKNITETDIVTKPGQEIKDVMIVIEKS
jgi:beta-lactamase regulating signal transducer with metallopeptidase domain/protocatechuate 3,4-dioxygenase beta subunit